MPPNPRLGSAKESYANLYLHCQPALPCQPVLQPVLPYPVNLYRPTLSTCTAPPPYQPTLHPSMTTSTTLATLLQDVGCTQRAIDLQTYTP